jgi:DNA-binding GntR family transcriptional regulator
MMAPRKTQPIAVQPRPSMDQDPVVLGILKAISLKRIRPGTKLGEDQLVEAFGTNRVHVRQVLAHLGSRNVVTLYPNRGAYIARPSVEEARQVFATRRVLERAVVAELVETLTPKQAAELRRHVEREHAHADDDRWGVLSVTGEFHSLIAHLTGNAVLAKFLEELVLRTSLIIAAFEPQGSVDCSHDAHPVIARLILDRDKDAAVAAMDEHLDAMQSRLRLEEPAEETEDITQIFAQLGVGRRARGKAN